MSTQAVGRSPWRLPHNPQQISHSKRCGGVLRRGLLRRARFALLCFSLLPLWSSAQYYTWGRSPQSLRWNQIETCAGRVVFPDYFGQRATTVAQYLKKIRPYINYGFDYGPLKLPLILHTENFQSNGLVMWAPKRMEFEAIAPSSTFAEPWLKQLATHEYRHAVQYGNLHRRFMRALGVAIGQQAGLLSSVLLPVWFLEGDAVMAETEMATFGRALQPSFTIEYRAYLTEGEGMDFALDKWFCGSYKNYIPDHYQFGYQLVAWSRERYGERIWSRVAEYGARYPYTILTAMWSLHKYYGTSVSSIAHETLQDLRRFWLSQPVEPNSAELLPTPQRSYTRYQSPMRYGTASLLAMKSDMDRTACVVQVDLQGAKERTLFRMGNVNTPPVLYDSTLYWTEYRNSTLWEQRVNSRLCSYDLRTGQRKLWRQRGNTLFPTPLPDGRVVSIHYDYTGSYQMDWGNGVKQPLPDTLSVHGLAYDTQSGTLALIALSDEGMSIQQVDTATGRLTTLKPATYATLSDLRAGAGQLSFHSIASGKDEIHLWDLSTHREVRVSRSRYGSTSPAPPAADSLLYFTTYTLNGYQLARQRVTPDSLFPVPPTRIPVNRVNPTRRPWNLFNIDTLVLKPSASEDTLYKPRRYRKGTHLFNLHSWVPWDFNPFHLVDEDRINIRLGATLMSQNLLSSTSGCISYGYLPSVGSRIQGTINYYGLAPKFELSATYGGKQVIYGGDFEVLSFNLKTHYQIGLLTYLPLTLSSGAHVRQLTPMFDLRHLNAIVYNDDAILEGYQRMAASLLYSDNWRMAVRDLAPRWGYAVRVTSIFAPARYQFGNLFSFYGRLYTPGILPHHSLMLRGNLQMQNEAPHNFLYKELYPRGARYDIAAQRYGALSADYQFPVWYPDGGINSILYISRIRMSLFYDFARIKPHSSSNNSTLHNVTSFGGEITLDIHPFRIPGVKNTSVGVYLYRPSDKQKVVVGVHLSLPI